MGKINRIFTQVIPSIFYTQVNPGAVKIYTLEGDGDGVLTSGVARVLVEGQRAVTRHFQRTYDCTIRKVSQGWCGF